MKSLYLFGLTALASVALHGQIYYSSDPNLDCSGTEGITQVTNASGGVLGYSCYESGTFVWLAAGGPVNNPWASAIRVGAPASNPIGVQYLIYDKSGNPLNVDTRQFGNNLNEIDFALDADQPSEVDILGAGNTAHTVTQDGSIYATFLCPDAFTCENVLPQLIYSALPYVPWSLSVPIAWDDSVWTQWSAEGIDNGSTDRVSFIVYNEGTTATSFNIQVFDSNGNLFSSGSTPTIAGFPTLSDGSLGEAQTFADLLSSWVTPVTGTAKLPTGVFKVLFDGGDEDSAVDVLQFTGASATTLQVAYDSPAGLSANNKVRRTGANPNARRAHMAHAVRLFSPFPKGAPTK